MAEAAMALALPVSHRFAIVTTAPRMIAYTEEVVRVAGLAERCAAVRAVSLPALSATPGPELDTVGELAAAIHAVRVQAGADLVILGGSPLSPSVVPIPVLEPIACGVQAAEALVRLGLRQSKAEHPA